MIVVSNTSLLNNLAAIGRFELLRDLYREVQIAAVTETGGTTDATDATASGWPIADRAFRDLREARLFRSTRKLSSQEADSFRRQGAPG